MLWDSVAPENLQLRRTMNIQQALILSVNFPHHLKPSTDCVNCNVAEKSDPVRRYHQPWFHVCRAVWCIISSVSLWLKHSHGRCMQWLNLTHPLEKGKHPVAENRKRLLCSSFRSLSQSSRLLMVFNSFKTVVMCSFRAKGHQKAHYL